MSVHDVVTHQTPPPARRARSTSVELSGITAKIMSSSPPRPGSFVPSPAPTGACTSSPFSYPFGIPSSISFGPEEGMTMGYASTNSVVVAISDDSCVIADSYEEGMQLPATSLAASEFEARVAGLEGGRPDAIDTACIQLNAEIEGQVVLLGSIKDGDRHFIFNHGAGMVYLARSNGTLTRVTDWVLPDRPEYQISGSSVAAGEILYVDGPIRCHPRATLPSGAVVHASRGLGYGEEISTKPIISMISQGANYDSGDHLIYLTRAGAQNVQAGELAKAWMRLCSEGCSYPKSAAQLATWLNGRADEYDRNIAIAIKQL
ncbi:MAG: hypothetical protein S4CHLAM81_10300 [Chlamydiales bacterium]|nr:hypothetical protein [Chlamydiales bacterium]MCH9635808.1 hypothetical protein [Chlamydiales bacterium]MCH9703935.1 hypothetical protein [Chlamydiota bacterium]